MMKRYGSNHSIDSSCPLRIEEHAEAKQDEFHELFPDTVMSGDDWEWGIDEDYPIRKPVKQFCQQHDRHLIVDAATWLIDRTPPTIGYRWYRRKERLATKITRYRNKLQNRRAA